MFVVVVTITIILPVSYARTVPVQRNLTLTVTGRREMNKVRCRACGSARNCVGCDNIAGLERQTASQGRKLVSAELNHLAKVRGSLLLPGQTVRHVTQNLCNNKKNREFASN